VRLIGDGAAQFTVQELGTLARERLTPVVVVADNDGYTVERVIHGPTPFTTTSSAGRRAQPNAHRAATEVPRKSGNPRLKSMTCGG